VTTVSGGVAATPDTLRGVDVLIVDDHQVFAEVLALRLRAETGVRRVVTAGSLSRARSRVSSMAGCVILLDYHLGDECGLDLLESIDVLDPRPTVVMVSGSRDPDKITAALRAGVDAWVLKSEQCDALVEVAVDARNNVMTLPRASLGEVIRRFVSAGSPRPADPTFLDTLSRREHDVLRLLVSGLTRHQIAERLVISPHTVRSHVQKLHHRAAVHSTVALVARAREAGLET
jgi:DNA-binding NarL/FixJ family response regulator